jgi:hypothetical protein
VPGTIGNLVADSSETTGLKWVAPAGGGKVLQVVQTSYTTEFDMSSTTWADTGLSASITPSSTNSKVLVIATQYWRLLRQANSLNAGFRLLRGSTYIWGDDSASSPYKAIGLTVVGVNDWAMNGVANLVYLDSPSTTSSTTYKTQVALNLTANSAAIRTSDDSMTSSIILMEIGA